MFKRLVVDALRDLNFMSNSSSFARLRSLSAELRRNLRYSWKASFINEHADALDVEIAQLEEPKGTAHDLVHDVRGPVQALRRMMPSVQANAEIDRIVAWVTRPSSSCAQCAELAQQKQE